jgi:hypothetical protein
MSIDDLASSLNLSNLSPQQEQENKVIEEKNMNNSREVINYSQKQTQAVYESLEKNPNDLNQIKAALRKKVGKNELAMLNKITNPKS